MTRLRVLLCAAVVAGALQTPVTAGPSRPSVVGGAGSSIPDADPDFGGDPVELNISARELPSGQIRGSFDVRHHRKSGGLFAHLHAVVDCLSVQGPVAKVTGTITSGAHGGGFDPVGHRMSLIVTDGSPDTFEFDASFLYEGGKEIAPCSADGPLDFTAERGNLTVQ